MLDMGVPDISEAIYPHQACAKSDNRPIVNACGRFGSIPRMAGAAIGAERGHGARAARVAGRADFKLLGIGAHDGHSFEKELFTISPYDCGRFRAVNGFLTKFNARWCELPAQASAPSGVIRVLPPK
jgi:hypothetical protein